MACGFFYLLLFSWPIFSRHTVTYWMSTIFHTWCGLSAKIHCQVNQICRFSKAFGSENYRLAQSGEKHLATVFVTSSKFRK